MRAFIKYVAVPVLVVFCIQLEGKEYLRVVSLSPAVTEMIFKLGGGNKLVGRSSACDYPVEVKSIPVAGMLGIPDAEKIISQRANVVITDTVAPGGSWSKLEKAGIRVVRLSCRRVEDYRNNVMTVGRLLKLEKSADAEVRRFYREIDELKTNGPFFDIPVLVLLGVNPFVSCNKNTFVDEIVTLAGANNIARDITLNYFVLSPEYVIKRNPQAVIAAGVPGDVKKYIRSVTAWKHLDFMQNDAVIDEIPSELLCRLSPRTPQAVKLLRKMLLKKIECKVRPEAR